MTDTYSQRQWTHVSDTSAQLAIESGLRKTEIEVP
jgi:hypothetical protein